MLTGAEDNKTCTIILYEAIGKRPFRRKVAGSERPCGSPAIVKIVEGTHVEYRCEIHRGI
jgi:hypothetical protein